MFLSFLFHFCEHHWSIVNRLATIHAEIIGLFSHLYRCDCWWESSFHVLQNQIGHRKRTEENRLGRSSNFDIVVIATRHHRCHGDGILFPWQPLHNCWFCWSIATFTLYFVVHIICRTSTNRMAFLGETLSVVCLFVCCNEVSRTNVLRTDWPKIAIFYVDIPVQPYTVAPEMAPLAASGQLQNVIEYCIKMRKKSTADKE